MVDQAAPDLRCCPDELGLLVMETDRFRGDGQIEDDNERRELFARAAAQIRCWMG